MQLGRIPVYLYNDINWSPFLGKLCLGLIYFYGLLLKLIKSVLFLLCVFDMHFVMCFLMLNLIENIYSFCIVLFSGTNHSIETYGFSGKLSVGEEGKKDIIDMVHR